MTKNKSQQDENKKPTNQTPQDEEIIDPKDIEIETLKSKLEEMTESGKRLMADMTNLKRRNDEERLKAILYANKNLLTLLLPGLDNLKRALSHLPENSGEWGKGIEMSIRQIEKAMIESGLNKMETIEKTFNPELHEAVLQGDGEENKILETLEDGYLLGDLVLRHAKVKIGNGNSETTKETQS